MNQIKESWQVILQDSSGRLFFHKNHGAKVGSVRLSFFWGEKKGEEAWYETVIRELWEEAGIILRPENLVYIWEDGPIEFEKGKFLAKIYFALLTPESANMIQNAETFQSYNDFSHRGINEEWITDLDHIRSLVDNALHYHGNNRIKT